MPPFGEFLNHLPIEGRNISGFAAGYQAFVFLIHRIMNGAFGAFTGIRVMALMGLSARSSEQACGALDLYSRSSSFDTFPAGPRDA
jgi:hypothetical protein